MGLNDWLTQNPSVSFFHESTGQDPLGIVNAALSRGSPGKFGLMKAVVRGSSHFSLGAIEPICPQSCSHVIHTFSTYSSHKQGKLVA